MYEDTRQGTIAKATIFLEHLATYGLVNRAAKHACPDSKYGAISTFRDLRNRDAEFAKAWDEAVQEAEDKILMEMRRRGVEGYKEDVFGSLGQGAGTGKVGERHVYSDRMLELYARTKSAAVAGALNTNRVQIEGTVTTKPMELGNLNPEQLALLEQLLDTPDTNEDE